MFPAFLRPERRRRCSPGPVAGTCSRSLCSLPATSLAQRDPSPSIPPGSASGAAGWCHRCRCPPMSSCQSVCPPVSRPRSVPPGAAPRAAPGSVPRENGMRQPGERERSQALGGDRQQLSRETWLEAAEEKPGCMEVQDETGHQRAAQTQESIAGAGPSWGNGRSPFGGQ